MVRNIFSYCVEFTVFREIEVLMRPGWGWVLTVLIVRWGYRLVCW